MKQWNYLPAQKKSNRQNKERENVLSLEAVEVVLVQCNLVDNQYQQKSEVSCTFTPNKSYFYLLNIRQSNFLKTYDTGSVLTAFREENGRSLEIEDKVNLTLPILSIRDFFFLSQTLTIHRTAGEGRGPYFIPLYHFQPLTNIEKFICNFACETTITYFQLQRLCLPDCYLMIFTTLSDYHLID